MFVYRPNNETIVVHRELNKNTQTGFHRHEVLNLKCKVVKPKVQSVKYYTLSW